MDLLDTLTDATLDLLLGSHCLGCEQPGRLVCRSCAAGLVAQPAPCWPTPVPPGLVEPWAAASYDALPRDLVLGLKERGLLALARPLAGLLADTVAALLAERSPPAAPTTVLVPVPSRTSTVRARGHDAVATITRGAARRLRADGHDVLAAPLLRLRPGVADQSGLDAAARHRNLAGSMTCPAAGLDRLRRAVGRGGAGGVRVVVCDDVVTTGSTLREAQRALQAVGLPVVAVAAVAATRLRHDAAAPVGPGPLPRSGILRQSSG